MAVQRTAGELRYTAALGCTCLLSCARVARRLSAGLRPAQVIIFVIYLLEGQRKRTQPRRGGLVARIQGRIQKYMTIKLALSLLNGLVAWLIYRFLRLDLALAFGFIHFVLNFIPSVGPLVAVLIPLPVVLVDPKLEARAAAAAPFCLLVSTR